jgi:hypothetical protein
MIAETPTVTDPKYTRLRYKQVVNARVKAQDQWPNAAVIRLYE